MFLKIFFLILLISSSVFSKTLDQVIKSESRAAEYKKRDIYRNPFDTLSFFKITDKMSVIELQPSGGNSPAGWYTEILARHSQ
jgi:predicted methyltransferase